MILTKQQQIDFETAAIPLIIWLNENCHPHVSAIVEPSRIELVEGIFSMPVNDYVPD